jgi:hypothetical protein
VTIVNKILFARIIIAFLLHSRDTAKILKKQRPALPGVFRRFALAGVRVGHTSHHHHTHTHTHTHAVSISRFWVLVVLFPHHRSLRWLVVGQILLDTAQRSTSDAVAKEGAKSCIHNLSELYINIYKYSSIGKISHPALPCLPACLPCPVLPAAVSPLPIYDPHPLHSPLNIAYTRY